MDKINERANLDVLLNCLAQLDNFEPTSVGDNDKPDFIITCAEKKIGVETTWSVYQEMVRAGKLHRSQCPHLPIITSDLKDGEKRRSNEEILESMVNPFPQWKKVEDVWSDWKNKIAVTLASKRQKLNQTDYQLFDENWLLVTDYPPLARGHSDQVCSTQVLQNIFSETSIHPRDFNVVYVRSGQYLFRWQARNLELADTNVVSKLTLIENAPPI